MSKKKSLYPGETTPETALRDSYRLWIDLVTFLAREGKLDMGKLTTHMREAKLRQGNYATKFIRTNANIMFRLFGEKEATFKRPTLQIVPKKNQLELFGNSERTDKLPTLRIVPKE